MQRLQDLKNVSVNYEIFMISCFFVLDVPYRPLRMLLCGA